MYLRVLRNLCFLSVSLFVLSSYTSRTISSRSLNRVGKRFKMEVIATGHDTINDVKVPKLRFEFQGKVSPEQALQQFKRVYWEVMKRTEASSPDQTIQETVLPNGQSGASIMVRYVDRRTGSRVHTPYVSLVFNLDDGRIIVSTFDSKTEKFKILAEATVSELFGFADPCEERRVCQEVSEKPAASEGGE